MPPLKRIPSSIRVRRNDSDYQRSTFHSSANEYVGSDRDDQPPADDDVLRQEMGVVRQAIHDDRQRQRTGKSPSHKDAELPPLRLHDQASQPPPRKSSRRMGAVENLALRHKKQQRKAASTATSSSASAESHMSKHDHDLRRSSGDDSAAATDAHPQQPQRQLSHVTEETPRRAGPSTSRSDNPPSSAAQSYFGGQQESSTAPGQTPGGRSRRATTTDDGMLASSRQFLGNLLRRNSEAPPQRLDDNERSPEHHDQSNVSTPGSSEVSDVHEDEVVDYLDVVDPEVSTVTTLQNVGNSIFFPPIPMLYNRRPTINLPSMQRRQSRAATPASERQPEDIEMGVQDGSAASNDMDKVSTKQGGMYGLRRMTSYVTGRRKKQVPETTEEERRKHIKEWAEMDEDERCELDEHVEMLLTRKAKFKRGLKGFWRYVKTPHGLIITLYAVSVTFWGTAICLFLLRWIDVNNPARQRYWIEICDQILCALFAAVGLGFAPFRAVDTYRMIQIVHYHKLTYKRRKQLDLPKLQDKNELPRATPRVNAGSLANSMFIKTGLRKDPNAEPQVPSDGHLDSEGVESTNPYAHPALEPVPSHHSSEVERLKESRKHHRPDFLRKKDKKSKAETEAEQPPPPKTYVNKDGVMPLGQLKRNPSIASELVRDAEDVVVLSPKQQANLEYQQRKFHESHTFYRYRETVTHRPFELSLMMAIVILLDGHSCLQASLGGTTWGIYYKNRPTSVTATIITFSLSCNAVAGILIWWGGSRTKKKDEVSRLLHIALEEQALHKIQKKHKRQQIEALQQQQQQQQRDHMSDAQPDPSTGPGIPPAQQTPALESIQEH